MSEAFSYSKYWTEAYYEQLQFALVNEAFRDDPSCLLLTDFSYGSL